jgi:hypothetical protein
MNQFVKYLLIILASNIILFVIFFIPAFTTRGNDSLGPAIIAFLLIGLSLLVQLIVGLVFLNQENKREMGQAMLLSTGIFLLIGFSICSAS